MKLRIVILAAVVLLAQVAAPSASAKPTCVLTKDRISAEDMTAMVQGPVDLLAHRQLEEAQAEVERLIKARASPSQAAKLAAADTLLAFAIELPVALPADHPDQARYLEVALVYGRRALAAYVDIFGPEHPEVVLTMTTLAEMVEFTNPDSPPDEAVELAEKSYALSRKLLGDANVETAHRLNILARIVGRPGRTRGDAAAIERSSRMFEKALRDWQAVPCETSGIGTVLWEHLDMLVDNRRPDEAVQTFVRLSHLVGEDREQVALFFAGSLREGGYDALADKVQALVGGDPI